MISRNFDASDVDLADQALPAMAGDEYDEAPGPEIPIGDHADVADVIEQHQPVPSGEDDYDR